MSVHIPKSVSYMRMSSTGDAGAFSGFQNGGASASAAGQTFRPADPAASGVRPAASYRIGRPSVTQPSRTAPRGATGRYRIAG